MAKILFVLRDLAPMKMAAKMIPLLQNMGHEITTILEPSPVQSAWATMSNGLPYETFLEDYDSGIGGYLLAQNPDLVVVGLSHPINLEYQFAKSADLQGFPLCFLDDVGGAWVRCPNVAPNLLLTATISAKRRAAKHFGPSGRLCEVVTVGLQSLPQTSIEIPKGVENGMTFLRKINGRVLVYSDYTDGDGIAAEEQIHLLIECLKQSDETCCIVPLLHPKWRGRKWERWISLLQSRGPVHHIVAPSSESVVACADMTVSGSGSSMLKVALWCGQRAVALKTPATTAFCRTQFGAISDPLVEDGYLKQVEKPVDLFAIEDTNLVDRFVMHPFSAGLAVNAIHVFVSTR